MKKDDNMNEVKEFIDSFCKIEAELENRKTETYFIENVEELSAYNNLLEQYYSYFTPSLKHFQGHLPITALEEDEDVLEMIRSQEYPKANPRHLYKISHYRNGNNSVWVVYLSNPKPDESFGTLTNAFFLINEGELKIANTMLYSNYSSDGKQYQWESLEGDQQLNFNFLKKMTLEKIERIKEPQDFYDSHKNYYGEF